MGHGYPGAKCIRSNLRTSDAYQRARDLRLFDVLKHRSCRSACPVYGRRCDFVWIRQETAGNIHRLDLALTVGGYFLGAAGGYVYMEVKEGDTAHASASKVAVFADEKKEEHQEGDHKEGNTPPTNTTMASTTMHLMLLIKSILIQRN